MFSRIKMISNSSLHISFLPYISDARDRLPQLAVYILADILTSEVCNLNHNIIPPFRLKYIFPWSFVHFRSLYAFLGTRKWLWIHQKREVFLVLKVKIIVHRFKIMRNIIISHDTGNLLKFGTNSIIRQYLFLIWECNVQRYNNQLQSWVHYNFLFQKSVIFYQ